MDNIFITHIFLNGENNRPPLQYKNNDFVIAVDGGRKWADFWHYPVNLNIGDFDSFAKLSEENNLIFPREKDFTDWELTLDFCQKNKHKFLSLCGIFGGDLDHQFANFAVLKNHNFVVLCSNNKQKVLQISAPFLVEFTAKINSNISILALEKLHNLSSQGLYWQLNNDILETNRAHACRNKNISQNFLICAKIGKALIFLAENTEIKSIKSNIIEIKNF